MAIRYHHAVSNFEETTKIPILMSLPGRPAERREVKARVRNIDIAPTILEILGLEPSPKMSGRSLLPLVRGTKEPDERVVAQRRPRYARAHRRQVARDLPRGRLRRRRCYRATTGDEDKCITVAEELFDLDADPGERRNVAKQHPDVMDEMRARLAAAKKNVVVAGTQASVAPPVQTARIASAAPDAGPPRLRLRFAGAGGAHRVSGRFTFAAGTKVAWEPVGVARTSIVQHGESLDVALTTAADAPIGLDVTPTPASADVHWELFLDDGPWPALSVFAGPYGLFDARVATGLAGDEARELAFAHALPTIDPARDLGLFVVREQATAHEGDEGARSNAGASAEMDRLLREWGYAHGPSEK